MTEQLKPEGKFWRRKNDDGKYYGEWYGVFEQVINPGQEVTIKKKDGSGDIFRVNNIAFTKDGDKGKVYFCTLVSWQAHKSIREGISLGIPVKKKSEPQGVASKEASLDDTAGDDIPF